MQSHKKFDTCDQQIGLSKDGSAHVWLIVVDEGPGLARVHDVAVMLQVLVQSLSDTESVQHPVLECALLV